MDIWDMNEVAAADAYAATQPQRLAVFKKIEPAQNWKLPIDAWIDCDDYEECNQAAIWFTGGSLVVEEIAGNRLRVTSGGYYANVGV